ncbi:MAG: cupin domain-containing protein [Proteobacteria bacterium]|nr:cupin domain-containing protein [Pseudomonadota bacterium]
MPDNETTDTERTVVNVDEVEEITHMNGQWGGAYQVLTPSMRPRGGSLGVNRTRLPPGHTTCPFHYHQREDEVFFILSGRGMLRYGDEIKEIRPGDCISCPAGTKIAHQIANPFDEDLIYLAIGPYDPDEVCVYPDNGKVLVRSIQRIGFLENVDYMEGEPETPKIFDLLSKRG